MKKTITLLFILTVLSVKGQFNQDAPWMKNLTSKQIQQQPTFQEIQQAFNLYWKTHDKDTKGSGYKPFMRWMSHWENYLKPNGTLMTPADIWEVWQQKNTMTKNSVLVDNSNWQSVGPVSNSAISSTLPGQGRVNAIAVDPGNPNTYYVGTPAGGLWRSTDAGVNWTALTDKLPQIGVSGIAIDHSNPSVIYISTGDDDAGDTFSVGVMKSVDGGITWNTTGLTNTTGFFSSNEIYMHPTDPNTLWVATNQGVFKTTNGGTSWTNGTGVSGKNI
ncbi:MAG: glycosyl hydrolase, partial [Flavobacteriaceae bacterium]|nr:glycosyl hydrolase [Flavobacteriaceae bacterium]